MTLEGIDVSTWQVTTPSLAGLDFAFARATYGTTPDARYGMHAAAFRAAGLVTGAYHFGRSGQYVSVPAQIGAFLDAARDAELLALDLEADHDASGRVLKPMSDEEAARFIAGVRAAGRRCGLYHSRSGYPIALASDFRWIAEWDATPPNIAWDFWQYAGSGVDRDRYSGSRAALWALAGRKPMRTFTITGASGTATVKADSPHSAPTLDGGPSSGWPKLTAGQRFTNALPIHLAAPVPGGMAGENRSDGYLAVVNGLDCIVLAKDSDFVPAATDAKHKVGITIDGVLRPTTVTEV